MKTWSRAFALLLLAAAVPALAVVMPMRIPFQGKLIDPATNNPKNGSFSMVFKIWTAPSGGTQLFTETQTVGVVNGIFSVQVGTISYLSADMLSGTSAYLGVTVGADAEMTPRQPLSMSPYAYTAIQLAQDGNIRINPGITYSTFSSAGNLALQYGVTGTTAAFAVLASTGVGDFGVVTSSGINIGGGTLKLDSDSKGIDASGTGIVASTASFTTSLAVGGSTFSIAGGSATLAYGMTAGSFTGVGADLTSVRTEISTFGALGTIPVATGATEVIIASAPITPSRTTSIVSLHSVLGLRVATAAAAKFNLRVRRLIAGGPCVVGSPQVGGDTGHSLPATANTINMVPLLMVDNPATTSQTWYCITATHSAAVTEYVSSRTFILSESQ